ncbi:MAG TPA: hypothetical protein VHE53_00915 [Patescibacteria group bacterium]|nr:hypothetical protein [Patescibacteria group bacterium]
MNEKMLIAAHKAWKKGEAAENLQRSTLRSAYHRGLDDRDTSLSGVNFLAGRARELANLALTSEEEIYWATASHDFYIESASLYATRGDKARQLNVLSRASELSESLFSFTRDFKWANSAIDEKVADAELYLELGKKDAAAFSLAIAANIAGKFASRAGREGSVPFREKICEFNIRSGQLFLEVGDRRRAITSHHILRETAYSLMELTGDPKYSSWIEIGDRFFESLNK